MVRVESVKAAFVIALPLNATSGIEDRSGASRSNARNGVVILTNVTNSRTHTKLPRPLDAKGSIRQTDAPTVTGKSACRCLEWP